MDSIDTFEFPVHPANVEQASEWDGADGEHWATYHQEYERILSVFDTPLVDAGGVGSADRCLEVGCGTGSTTRVLATRAAQGSVLGLDLSGPMLAIAKEGAESAGIDNIEFVQGDAQVFPFAPASFDVAISRMGCMFFGDPATAFANIGRALAPGGRFAATVWQAFTKNVWITAIDEALGEPPADETEGTPTDYAPGPFSLADPELCGSLLRGAGFVDVEVSGLDIPLTFGTVDEAQVLVDSWIEEDLSEDQRAQMSRALRRLLADNVTQEGVLLPSATWLITARRPSA